MLLSELRHSWHPLVSGQSASAQGAQLRHRAVSGLHLQRIS